MKISAKLISFFNIFVLLFVLIVGFSTDIFAKQDSTNSEVTTTVSDSIYLYLSSDELALLITYSSYEELVKMAQSLNIKVEDQSSIENIRKLLYEYFGFKEQVPQNSGQTIFIKSSDIVNITDDGKIIELRGNNFIILGSYIFKADRIIYYVDEEVFYGYGNAYFKSDSMVATCDSLEYSIKKMNGTLKNITLTVSGYIIYSELGYIAANEIFTTDFARVTMCNEVDPHYYLNVRKVLYSESIIYFYNIEFVIGETSVAYFPLYISYEKGYQLPFLFGLDYGKREGFMIFNTISGKNYDFFIDIYQRLGIFSGFNFDLINNDSNLNLSISCGAAISPDLFYDGTYDIWSIIPTNSEFTLDNVNFRAGLEGTFTYKFFNLINSTFSFAYYTDPYFKYDYFERERFLRFKIDQFTSFYWPNIYPSVLSSFQESFNANFSLFRQSFNISSSLNFAYTNSDDIDVTYLYSPKYYYYYLSSLKLYSFSLSGNILSFSEKWISFSLSQSSASSYNSYYKTTSEVNKNVFYLLSTISPVLSINLYPFSYSFSSSNSFTYTNTDNITSTNQEMFFSSSISNTMSFNLKYFKLSLGIYQSYRNSIIEPLDFGWLSNYANLSLSFLPFSSLSLTVSTKYNFLDSTVQQLWELNEENLETIRSTISYSSTYFSINMNSVYNINTGVFNSYYLSSTVSLPKLTIFSFILNLYNRVSISLDNVNFFNSTFQNNFGLNIMLEDKFIFNMQINSQNLYIYRYNDFSEAFLDLMDSFNFFDIDARLKSYFDLQSISFTLQRQLHDMIIRFSIVGSFVLSSDQTKYNFVLSYSFSIVSIFLAGYEYDDTWESYF